MAAVPTGDPMDPATVLGPVVSRGQLDELSAQVADSVTKVGRSNGRRPFGPAATTFRRRC